MHTHGTFCSLGNSADRVSHLIGWPLIRLLHVLESVATQWVSSGLHHCVLANFLWLFLLGSCAFRCLLRCPWKGKTQIWPEDLRLTLLLVCFMSWFMICQFAYDDLCSCCSFLAYSHEGPSLRAWSAKPEEKSCSSKISAFVLIPASWFVSCVSLPVLFFGSVPVVCCLHLLVICFCGLSGFILLRSCGFLLVPSWFVFGGCLPVLSLLRSDGFVFFAGARCLSAGHHLRLTRGPAGNEPSSFWRFCAYLLRGSFKRHLPGLGCPILATKLFEDVCSDWRRSTSDCPSATWVPTSIVITGHCHWADLGQ